MTKTNFTSSKVGATAAGAGCGTLLVVISSQLSDSNPIKQWLVVAAPTFSVTLSSLWFWAQLQITNYIQDKKIEALAQKTKNSLVEALNNLNTSPEHRESIRDKLEELGLGKGSSPLLAFIFNSVNMHSCPDHYA